jgi:adenylate cyclase
LASKSSGKLTLLLTLALPLLIQVAALVGLINQFSDLNGELLAPLVLTYGGVILVAGVSAAIAFYRLILSEQRQAEEKFTKVFRSSPDAVAITTLEAGQFLEANESFCRMVGYGLTEIIGKTVVEVSFWLNHADRADMIQRLQAEGIVHSKEFNFCTRTGAVKTGLLAAEILVLDGQECILSIIKDITDRKQDELELQATEKRYRDMFDNLLEGFFQTTEDGRFLAANPALAKIFGYSSPIELIAELGNVSKQLYVKPKRRVEFLAYMQLYGVVSDFESQMYRRDGSAIWIAENVRAVRDQNNKLLYFEGTVQDVTERRQMEEELRQQRLRAERLLLNILPQTIAERLKRGQLTIASRFDAVTVMFADLVDFTQLAARVSATDLVKLLGEIFSEFDRLVEQHHLEKIKTIGDAYMVAGGLPVSTPESAIAIARMALDMQRAIAHIHFEDSNPFQLRIGINSGAIVAGVIGTKKFSYDLWGDTVNVASRMETLCLPGKIQVSAATYELLKDHFIFEERGIIVVKGKGEMKTYWLVGAKEKTKKSRTHSP